MSNISGNASNSIINAAVGYIIDLYNREIPTFVALLMEHSVERVEVLHAALGGALAATDPRSAIDLVSGDPVPSQDPSGTAHAASPAAGSERPAMIPVSLSAKDVSTIAAALTMCLDAGEPVQLAQDALDNYHVKFKLNHGSWSPGFGTTEEERMR